MNSSPLQVLLIFTAIITLSQANQPVNHDDFVVPREVTNIMKRTSKFCVVFNKLTKEDKEQIRNNMIPTSDSGQGYIQCMLEKIGLISGGKFKSQKAMIVFESFIRSNPKKRPVLKQVAEWCEKECERGLKEDGKSYAVRVMQCLKKHQDYSGVKLPVDCFN